MTDLRFDGEVVVVTGAARGLGQTYALQLAERGATVVINDLPSAFEETENATINQIQAAGGCAYASPHDISGSAGAWAVAEDALSIDGRIDAVINNAGILRDADLTDLGDELWRSSLAVNLDAAFLLTAAVWESMRDRGYGRLLYTTSSSGLFGNIGQANYSAAKSGLLGLSRTAALEGAAHNIRSNAIAPLAATPMAHAADARPSSRIGARTLVGASTFDTFSPDDVAQLVILLSHDECPCTGGVFSSVGGKVSTVLVAKTAGWGSPGTRAEDLLQDWDRVVDRHTLTFPDSLADEMRDIAAQATRSSHP